MKKLQMFSLEEFQLFIYSWSLTRGAFWAGTEVCVLPVLTNATVLTRLAQTLVDVGFTQAASVARAAVTGEGSQAILAGAIMAGIRVALVDVNLTVLPCISCKVGDQIKQLLSKKLKQDHTINEKELVARCTFGTFTSVLVGSVSAFSSILAGCTSTLVNIHLTQTPWKPCRCIFWKLRIKLLILRKKNISENHLGQR